MQNSPSKVITAAARFVLFFLLFGLPLYCAAAVSTTNDLPLQIAGRIPFVKVSVNGEGPYLFIIDTGASENIIVPTLAARLGIKPVRVSASQHRGNVHSLQAGTATLSNSVVFITDPPQAHSLRLDLGIDYQGILGYPFLSSFLTTLDYRRKVVRFDPLPAAGRRLAPPGKDAVSVAFFLRDRLPHVVGTVNGMGPVTLLLDTGSSEVLLLPGAARQLNISGQGQTDLPGVAFTKLETLSLGAATVRNLPCVINTLPQERRAVSSYHGIVGTPFLTNFVVTVSYSHKQIILR